MSWLRSAVNRAVGAGGKNSVTRTVKSYADTVVHHAGQAVAGGAKMLQDSMGVRNYKSFRLMLKRLEEVAVSCRGLERTQLLRRWLVALKEVKMVAGVSLDDRSPEQNQTLNELNSSRNDSVDLYFDSDLGGEPMNFWDVFLQSQALEGLTLSMILEPPNEEEISLLLQIFRFCLTGGREVHNAILSSIQDLGNSFTDFQDEVLVKREEMLQFAQGAIAGLKVSADVARIDAKASALQQKVGVLVESRISSVDGHERKTEKASRAAIEALKEAVSEVQLCSKLEALLLEKRSIKNGDSPETHSEKVDKLKVLAESLSSCSLKAEKRISEHRHQKEEAVDYRVAKAKEVIEIEKGLSAEISGLEKQKDDLEDELKKVNTSLTAAKLCLKKTREERDQFDEASNQILMHLKSKEEDLLKSIATCTVEADVVNTWINFLEDTWLLQSSHMEQKEKQINDELERYGNYFLKLTTHHISACKEELRPAISRIRTYAYNLKNFRGGSEKMPSASGTSSTESDPRKFLEEEYLETEAKIITIFGVIDNMKELLNAEQGNTSRGDYTEIDKLFDDIDGMRGEFKSIERPRLYIENPLEKEVIPTEEKSDKRSPRSSWRAYLAKSKEAEFPKSAVVTTDLQLDPEAALVKLETEFGKVSKHYKTESLGWEFDDN